MLSLQTICSLACWYCILLQAPHYTYSGVTGEMVVFVTLDDRYIISQSYHSLLLETFSTLTYLRQCITRTSVARKWPELAREPIPLWKLTKKSTNYVLVKWPSTTTAQKIHNSLISLPILPIGFNVTCKLDNLWIALKVQNDLTHIESHDPLPSLNL